MSTNASRRILGISSLRFVLATVVLFGRQSLRWTGRRNRVLPDFRILYPFPAARVAPHRRFDRVLSVATLGAHHRPGGSGYRNGPGRWPAPCQHAGLRTMESALRGNLLPDLPAAVSRHAALWPAARVACFLDWGPGGYRHQANRALLYRPWAGALAFHTPIGYPIALDAFAIFFVAWLGREIAEYRTRKPSMLLERFGEAS